MKIEIAKANRSVTSEAKDFDPRSGSFVERLFFNRRLAVVLIFSILTVLLTFQATGIRMNASFERMIPTKHPYIKNFLQYKKDLAGLGNVIRIAVESKSGTIFDPEYLETLRQINDEVFLIEGVDRGSMKSLWTTSTRWAEVTEDGLTGGPVIPDDYDGSEKSVQQVSANVERSMEIGRLVSNNFESSTILVPLLSTLPGSNRTLDYGALSERLEVLRSKYQNQGVRIYITGFAKIVGDLIEGAKHILFFFLIATTIATLMVYWFTRCVRSTAVVVICSLVAVIWQLGIVKLLGLELDPYSMLVPFLVFSIGLSHGAQKMNGIMQDIGRGIHRLIAARLTFRRLFVAGLTALLSDAVGFAVLMIIKIGVIQQLALMASVGVAVLIFTNLIFLPILLSYTGVNLKAAQRSLHNELAALSGERKHPLWRFLDLFTHRKVATVVIFLAAFTSIAALIVRTHLQVGDLDPGAPELRSDSRYNLDNAYITGNYAASSDVLVVMVQTPESLCTQYNTLIKVDALGLQLQQLDSVESTASMATLSKVAIVGMNEGNLKWFELLNNQPMLNAITTRAPRELFNQRCDMLPLFVFLKDHKAATLSSVVHEVESFAAQNDTGQVKFLLAAGNAGIDAATNIVVKKSMTVMLFFVYGAVILLCYITFRSWRAVAVAVIPLMTTSVLCEALMVCLDIGIKVATLPVVALGVGIGVDYALYVLSIMLVNLRQGMSLSGAYYRTLLFTGKVVILTGATLSLGVATWAFSPIKFQANMGILLSFMFSWNMIGALVLMPSLARVLLVGKMRVSAEPIVLESSRACASPDPEGATHQQRLQVR